MFSYYTKSNWTLKKDDFFFPFIFSWGYLVRFQSASKVFIFLIKYLYLQLSIKFPESHGLLHKLIYQACILES